jgi:SAM-dependent methyltransferase
MLPRSMRLRLAKLWEVLRHRILPNLRYLGGTRVRRCGCCGRLSLFVSLSEGEEAKLCIRCRANLRYEMLADYIRRSYPDLERRVVVELDAHSPLRPLLRRAKSYTRTYFKGEDAAGTIRGDGARCEDITRLTFDDSSVDLIVSSEVLEHVPDLELAFRETERVLRPGGSHVFTVPPRPKTIRRAELVDGKVVHNAPPDYHADPSDPRGILAFWDFGTGDAAERFSTPGLALEVVDGPEGKDRRVVWRATKRG